MLKNVALKHNYDILSSKNKSLILKIITLIKSNTVQTSNFNILMLDFGSQILSKNSSNREDLPKNIPSCSQKFLDGRRGVSPGALRKRGRLKQPTGRGRRNYPNKMRKFSPK